MDIANILFWATVVGLALYVVSIYNHLVRIKHNVSRAWVEHRCFAQAAP